MSPDAWIRHPALGLRAALVVLRLGPTRAKWRACGVLLALAAASPAEAQLGAIFEKLLPGQAASAPAAAPARPVGAAAGTDVNSASPVKAPQAVLSELAPDADCKRPAERFNLSEKLAHYGGTAAALRLKRLVSTDFAFSDLTPEDKQMLQYLAQTTVWVPVEVEAKLGAIYDTASGIFGLGKPSLSEDEKLALDGLKAELDRWRQLVPDYPSEIRLTVEKDLADGAYARFGGVIQLSSRFLNTLEDAGPGAHFLLAHEMSHIYKRHALKNIQFKLISSGEGWELARQILRRAERGMAVDPIADTLFVVTVVPALVNFVRNTQQTFLSHQELEADGCSVVWLQRGGSDPWTAWRAFDQKLGSLATYTAEHPSNAERGQRIRLRAGGAVSAQGGRVSTGPDKGTVRAGGAKAVKDALKTK